MLSSNEKISLRQLQILLILDIFGVGIISLPDIAAAYAKQDAWISVLISAAIAFISVFIITSLCRRFYKYTFFEYSCKILSKPVGVVVSLLFIIKLIFTASFQLRIFCEIIKRLMLERTPMFVTGAVMIIIAAYAASKGIETRARLAELLFLIVFIPMLLVIAFSAKDVDYSNILPVLKSEPQELIAGGFWSFISFTGIEFCLLVPGYVNKPSKLRKSTMGAVAFIGIAMSFVTVITICAFGYADATEHTWPVLDMINAISMPGSFIERQDAVIVSFWIISVFAFISACLFFTGELMKDVIKKGKRFYYVVLCCPVVFLISILPKNITEVYEMLKLLFLTLGSVFMLILPLIMLFITAVRGLGDKFEDK